MCRRKKLSLVVVCTTIVFLTLVWIVPAHSQVKYPTRAVTIIVPYPPGGATDVINRLIATFLSKKWGVPVNVVNKSGGMTVPATLELYQSPPDGYTMYGDSTNTIMLNVSVKNLPFDIMDRTFVSVVTSSSMALAVNPKSPLRSVKDVVEEIRKNPENVSWATFGGSGVGDLVQRKFFKVAGVDYSKTRPVMITSGAQTAQLLAGGHITMGFLAMASGAAPIRGGLVKPLAIASAKRDPSFPDIPTMGEQGYPGLLQDHWEGISGPPNLPAHIVSAWEQALQEFLNDPQMAPKIGTALEKPNYLNAADFKEFVKKQMEEVKQLWAVK
jgi:tripartite-type tricarboxylate transporter receptor subunit TctC